jgi:membrane-associated phospholipid phosphatase
MTPAGAGAIAVQRITVAVALAITIAVPARAGAAPDGDPPTLEGRTRTIHMIAIAAGITVYASSETFFKTAISPDHCRWCDANPFDRGVREVLVWDNTASAAFLSNVTGFLASPLACATMLALSASPGQRATRFLDDMIPVLEAVTATQLVTQIVKISAARQRPYAHFATELPSPTVEDNLSFFSGHSSLTMSIAISTGTVASRRGYRLAPAIWVTGLSLAAATMYLRIAADKHYASDVILGASFGAAAGYLVPHLTRALPAHVRVTPTANGVAVLGAF